MVALVRRGLSASDTVMELEIGVGFVLHRNLGHLPLLQTILDLAQMKYEGDKE